MIIGTKLILTKQKNTYLDLQAEKRTLINDNYDKVNINKTKQYLPSSASRKKEH